MKERKSGAWKGCTSMSTVKMNFVVCLPFFSHSPRIKGELRLLDAQQVCHLRHLYSFESIYFNINSIAREIEKSKIFPLRLEGPAAIPPPPRIDASNSKSKRIRIWGIFCAFGFNTTRMWESEGRRWGDRPGEMGRKKKINRKSFSRLAFPQKSGNRLFYVIVIYLLVKVIFH